MEAPRKEIDRFENVEFVEPPPTVVQVECPVCLQVLCKPHQVVCCGKSFCRVCIDRVKGEQRTCPTCKAKDYNVFHNKGLQQSLYQLQIYCMNRKAGCEWNGELGDLENHLNLNPDADMPMEGCSFSLISCKFEQIGCEVKLPRKDMKDHCDSSTANHLSLMVASHTKLLSMLKELTDRQQHLSRIGTPVTSFVEFTLKNYKQLKLENDTWYSPPFYSHPQGYKMCLRVDSNGNGEGKGTHISAFVCLMKGEFDDHLKWPFRGSISLRILSQISDENDRESVVGFTDKTPDANAGRIIKDKRGGAWGRHKFVHHDDMEEKFLKDDCLHLQITKVELK